jgi:hypothetical protein
MKTISRTGLFAFLFLFFGHLAAAQTAITITTCDTLLSDPSLSMPAGYYVITVKSASNTRLAYNTEEFSTNVPSPNINIYDGPGTTSPLYTTLGDFLLPNRKFGGQSSGSTLTFSFYSSGPAATITHFKIRIRCVQTPVNIPTFQPMASLGAGGNVRKADYDNDGDLDLLISGAIFRNDSYFDSLYKFERKPGVLDTWRDLKMCSADFNGDGFKDLFITGLRYVSAVGYTSQAAIYKNNGNNTFTEITTQTFEGASRGGCSIVDFNRDGKPDICYTGSPSWYQSTPRIFKIYLNNGNMNFTDANVTLPGVSGLMTSAMSWADSDGDGDEDLVINGHDGNQNITRFFTVNGNTFTNVNLNFKATSNGGIVWKDVNMDGKPDIINRGVATKENIDAIVPEIFFNNGNNTFTRTITNLPALYGGGMDWADYDGDNDMDVVIDGTNFSIGSDAAVYKNNGNGQFSRVGIDGAKTNSRVKWLDFTGDGKLDLVLAGGDGVGKGGYLLKNISTDSFRIVSFPITANEYDETAVIIEDFNNDGIIDILSAGELADADCNSNNFSTLVIGRDWRWGAMPKFTQVANLNLINPSMPGVSNPDLLWTWGDYDSDGKLDILASNQPYNTYANGATFLRIFHNDGNNNFSLAYNTLEQELPMPGNTGLSYYQPMVLDLDKDGKNELFFPFVNTVFKFVNNQFQISYTEYQGYSGGRIANCVDTADYNRDGFTDLVVSYSYYTAGGGTSGQGLYFYKNDRNGRLVLDSENSNSSESERQVKWADINNDGAPDLIAGDGIYENRNGKMFYVSNQVDSMQAVATGDYNNDGFLDRIDISNYHQYASVKVSYNEQGTFFFHEKEHGSPYNTIGADWDHAVESFDVDNDGDDDIIYSAPMCTAGGAAILVNEGNYTNRLIHVVSPNGGERFSINTSQPIKWYGYQVGATVKIELTRDSGVTWQVLAAAAPSSSSGGSYSWAVDGQLSNKCIIKITDNSSATFSDKSNAVFSIAELLPPVANAGRDTLICAGKNVRIGTSGPNTYTYAWTAQGGNFSSSGQTPLVSPSATTTYYLTVTNGALSSKDTVVVKVTSQVVTLPQTLINACFGSTYQIGVPAEANLLYQWSSTPSGFTSVLSNPQITPVVYNNDITYNLQVQNTVTGCTGTALVRVLADSCFTGGAIVYPNPANNFLTVKVLQPGPFPYQFSLVNSFGAIVLTKELQSAITPVNISQLQSGQYFWAVRSVSGQIVQSGSLSVLH